MINSIWFIALALMLAAYAVLDGFDLGIGVLHLVLGRTTEERTQLIDTIGPVWNGNEVWLLAAGGSMVVAFPTLYAASFSGFYLALMLVLWLLLLRGLGIEFRHQIHHPMWEHAWDVAFAVSSALLALLFGVAVGNVLRGVPFDVDGQFTGSFSVLLNPFAIVGGLLGVTTLAFHGACWAALKTDGDLQARARRFAGRLWFVSIAVLGLMIAASFAVSPHFTDNFSRYPVLLLVPAATLGALVLNRRALGRRDDRAAFRGSAAYVAGILASVAAGLYPMLLPPLAGSPYPGLDIYNSAAPPHSLRTALAIYLFGIGLVSIYLANIYRIWSGKGSESS
ncbi:MAG TPA: cytochrome d ubiquinol oxidase subunit II [Vicinamibacterales bacterium]|jgi:cytochrome d ubiquinol oxidase subunit II|nr:cytochrome d ubiquinol oxidase subunit II [Vicinamibacterales bacterium]